MLTSTSLITNKQIRGYFLEQQKVIVRNSFARKICGVIPQYSETEYFGNLGAIGNLEEVDKDYVPVSNEIPEWQYSVKLGAYKLQQNVPTSMFKFDQIGQVKGLLNDATARAFNLDDYLLTTALTAGTSATGFLYNGGVASNSDYGKYFFAADHVLGGSAPSAQSNLVTGNTPASEITGVSTLTDTIAKKIWTDLNNAFVAMQSWKDTGGQPYYQSIDPSSLAIVCGPLMAQVFRFAFQSQFLLQTDNVMKNAVGAIYTSNYLPSSGAGCDDWYLINTAARRPGMVIHEFRPRTSGEMQDPPREDGAAPITPGSVEVYSTFENPNDHWVQTTEMHAFWVKRWMKVGYGEPSSIIKVENSAS